MNEFAPKYEYEPRPYDGGDEPERYYRLIERAGGLYLTGRISRRWLDAILGRGYVTAEDIVSLLMHFENANRQLLYSFADRMIGWGEYDVWIGEELVEVIEHTGATLE